MAVSTPARFLRCTEDSPSPASSFRGDRDQAFELEAVVVGVAGFDVGALEYFEPATICAVLMRPSEDQALIYHLGLGAENVTIARGAGGNAVNPHPACEGFASNLRKGDGRIDENPAQCAAFDLLLGPRRIHRDLQGTV